MIVKEHVVRHNDNYFYSRWHDGRQQINAKQIDPNEAQDIITRATSTQDIETSARGLIRFDTGAHEFSFLAENKGAGL